MSLLRRSASVLSGTASIAAGLFLVKHDFLDALEAAKRHESSIRFSARTAVIGPTLVLAGLYLVVAAFAGPKLHRGAVRLFIDLATSKPRLPGIAITIVVVAGMAGFIMWFEALLASYGYAR